MVKKIAEFQKILRKEIRDEFGNISYEKLAEKILNCEEFLHLEKYLNGLILSSKLKRVDSTFKRIETGDTKIEHSELRRSLKELLKKI